MHYKIIECGIEYRISEWINGDKFWYKNELLHRESGPAIEFFKENKKWYYLNGICYNIKSDEEWLLFQIIT
jgi:hypothetical protein